MSTALQGLKILDFTQMMTGPFASSAPKFEVFTWTSATKEALMF